MLALSCPADLQVLHGHVLELSQNCLQVFVFNGISDVRKWAAATGSVLIVSYEKLTEALKGGTKKAASRKRKSEAEARRAEKKHDPFPEAALLPQARLCGLHLQLPLCQGQLAC